VAEAGVAEWADSRAISMAPRASRVEMHLGGGQPVLLESSGGARQVRRSFPDFKLLIKTAVFCE